MNVKPPLPTARARREAELAAALRANLRRRKAVAPADAVDEHDANKDAITDAAPLPNARAPG